jgi:hypothetical protein
MSGFIRRPPGGRLDSEIPAPGGRRLFLQATVDLYADTRDCISVVQRGPNLAAAVCCLLNQCTFDFALSI